jgi:hypothetical protein
VSLNPPTQNMSSESKRSKEKNTEDAATATPTPETTSTTTTASTFNLAQLFDTINENLTKFVNEFSKAQPEYAQAVSNLQQEYIDTAKDSIKIGTSAQKQLINNSSQTGYVPNPITATTSPFLQQLVTQSNDFTNNMIGMIEINSQFVINALNATKENLKNNRRLVKAAAEYGSNIANAWTFQNQSTKRQ